MSIVFSHTTALNLLMHRNPATAFNRVKHVNLTQSEVGKEIAKQARHLIPATSHEKPIEVLVRSPTSRRNSRNMLCNVWSTELPPYSFVEFGPNVFCASAELLAVQMAQRLTLIQEAELITNLCACYTLNSKNEEVSACPLTTLESIARFTYDIPYAKGVKKTRCALRYALENSASPAETKLALYNTLPPHLGGFGFERPMLNYDIAVPQSIRRDTMYDTIAPDEFFIDHNVAIEYQSNKWHSDKAGIQRDEHRRRIMERMGIQVVFVRTQDLYGSFQAYESVARNIAKHLGKRLRIYSDEQLAQRKQLYDSLFKV